MLLFSKYLQSTLLATYSPANLVPLLISLFFLVWTSHSSANPPDYRYQKAFRVQQLSLDDGLSQSAVSDIIQDQNGYIWLATEDGLNRYDSYDFEVFHHDFLDDTSLHENWVTKLLEEPGVGIWIGTARGISLYDPLEKKFTSFAEQDADLRSSVTALHMDPNGVIWVAAEEGLYFIDQNRKKVKRFTSSNNQFKPGPITTITGSGNYLYTAGNDCILRINLTNLESVNLCQQIKWEELKGHRILSILVVNKILWVGTNGGLIRYDLESASQQHFLHDPNDANSLSDDYVQALLFDDHGDLWVATTEGVSVYNQDRRVFRHYRRKIYTEDGLSSNDILSLFLDQDGLMWLGTYTGGVNILDPNQNRFDHIFTKSDVVKLGENNTVHAIEKDSSDNLWIASYGAGLFRYNLLSAQLSRPLNDAKIRYDKFVYTLMADRNNRLWIASLEELNLWDLENNEILETQFFIDGRPSKPPASVNRLFEDVNGDIFVGSNHGLFKITQVTQRAQKLHITLHDMTGELPESFTQYDTSILTIIQDSVGDYWFGGTAGLIHYRVKLNQWEHFKHSKGNRQSLSNDNVQVIFEDAQGFVWVGTGDGLNQVIKSKLGQNSVYFNRITTRDGLPNNSIYGILEDDSKQLWISTNSGIVKYASNSPGMEIYKKADGISSDEFNTGAYFTDENGWLFFGSINGVTVIKNGQVENKQTQKRLRYAKILVGTRSINVGKLNLSEDPMLVQGVDDVSINVKMVNVNYRKLGTQRYRYRINGLSDKWNYLATQRDVFITGLAEGDYQLEVQSRLIGNSWISQSKSLSIRVITSFWNSNQAIYVIALFVLILFVSAIYYVSLFYRRQLAVTSKRKDIESLRLKEIRSDKSTLGKELAQKEQEVAYLSNKIRLFEHKLDSEKYKDVATGFYRLSYLVKLFKRTQADNDNKKKADDLLDYQSIAILDLMNYQELYQRYDFLSLAEYLSKISSLIRNQLPSKYHVFFVRDGIFLVMSTIKVLSEFEQSLIELSDNINRTKFEIANGVSASANIAFTSADLATFKVTNKSDLPILANKILKFHHEILDSATDPSRPHRYAISVKNKKNVMNIDNDTQSFSTLKEAGIVELRLII